MRLADSATCYKRVLCAVFYINLGQKNNPKEINQSGISNLLFIKSQQLNNYT